MRELSGQLSLALIASPGVFALVPESASLGLMDTILVVDDSPTIRRMVRAALGSLGGVTFAEAASGLRAIEVLGMESVQMVVLDLNMPDMHGLDVIRFLRSHERYRQLPVLVLTTRGDESSRQAALDAGASVYLTKPFVPGALLSSVRDLLDTRVPRGR